MALFKIDFAAEGRMQMAFVLDASDEMSEEQVRAAFGEATDGLSLGSARRIADNLWFSTDREGIIVTQEDGDVEYEEPILSTETITVWGTESAHTLIEDAGVSAGYEKVAAEIAADEADLEARNRPDVSSLDVDDLARIADALKLAWKNGLYRAGKNPDEAMAAVERGMAGAYGETLAKVEQIIGD